MRRRASLRQTTSPLHPGPQSDLHTRARGWGLRLAAAATSAALAIYATGASIQDGVAPGLDDLLKLTFFSAILTIFSVAALCHAFNLIDGMNGLASTMALAACASLGAISYSVGDAQILAL